MNEPKETGEHHHPADRPEPGRQYVSDGIEPGPIPVPLIKVVWRRVSGRQAVRDVLQVATGVMVGVLFFVWGVFGSQAVSRQNQHILEGVRQEIAVHGQAAADRSCASTKLLAFIIFTGDKRAHSLHTGAYLSHDEKARIHGFVDDACRYEAPTLPGGTP